MDNSESASHADIAKNLYSPIFNTLKSVTHLDFVIKDDFRYPSLSLKELPSSACFSSTIVHLSIKLKSIEDCISLLDGRLNQLHRFIVRINWIRPSTNDLEDTVKVIRTFQTEFFTLAKVFLKISYIDEFCLFI